MSATTYKTWDDVPEEAQRAALLKGLEVTETEAELDQFLAKELGIPVETIPPGEMGIK